MLKESISVVPYKEAVNMSDGISLVDRFTNSLDLGSLFHSWNLIESLTLYNGYNYFWFIPPSQSVTTYITEVIEVTTMPYSDIKGSIDELFETEKYIIKNQYPKNIKFHILKKSPTEIIYSYSHPKNDLQLTAVVRSFITNRGYCSVSYKRGLNLSLKKEEIIQWKNRLETIKIGY